MKEFYIYRIFRQVFPLKYFKYINTLKKQKFFKINIQFSKKKDSKKLNKQKI